MDPGTIVATIALILAVPGVVLGVLNYRRQKRWRDEDEVRQEQYARAERLRDDRIEAYRAISQAVALSTQDTAELGAIKIRARREAVQRIVGNVQRAQDLAELHGVSPEVKKAIERLFRSLDPFTTPEGPAEPKEAIKEYLEAREQLVSDCRDELRRIQGNGSAEG